MPFVKKIFAVEAQGAVDIGEPGRAGERMGTDSATMKSE